LIGVAEVELSALEIDGPPSELAISTVKQFRDSKPPTVRVQRVAFGGIPTRKVLYIVRHGESVWNQAQACNNYGAMLGDTDHPLNQQGRTQAEGLQASLSAGGSDADALMASELVMCSPLTRAVQTCLIGLAPMLTQRPDVPLLLNPNLREKRNFGGMDSSGKWHGNALAQNVREAMLELYSDAPTEGQRLSAPQLDLTHVQDKWWLDSKENKDQVAARITELLAQVRFRPEGSIVLVGHSHYFRELLHHSMDASCTLHGSHEPRTALSKKKLSNGGVARLQVDFERENPIVGVELLFGTELVS